ncbi:MAG: molecular chaperone TorD family protein [Gordonibacter urolithinfaciens]
MQARGGSGSARGGRRRCARRGAAGRRRRPHAALPRRQPGRPAAPLRGVLSRRCRRGRCVCQLPACRRPIDGTAERDDYLGVELAFLDCLVRAEEAAYARGDGPAAAAYAQQRQSFEQEHLPWVAAFCTAALPHARTAYGRAALEALAARSARGNQPECFT